ncbi:hypothetical protein IEQ34_022648 [Dendrobium chrysotoxum]|uniref:Uncharacterized protein n=1 Tax=Dendrobium chrysotoxum TaxID=161865 RepID=A0AAV7FZL1_DENCH|nr:hypothetical protein IEQ34_022648 [Dendrobium chrysotoxum]
MDKQCQYNAQSRDNRIDISLGVGNSSTFWATSLFSKVSHICNFEALKDWFETRIATEDGCWFLSLIGLELYKCPKNCPKLISLGEVHTTSNCRLRLSDLIIRDLSVLLIDALRSITSLGWLITMGNY